MTEITPPHPGGAPGRYRHPPKLGESGYLSIGAEAKKIERTHTLAVIRAMLEMKLERGLTPEKILDELVAWMPRHLSKLDTHEESKP